MAKKSTDVVVVGAGFAGLTAARELERAGLDVIVWESRDRVGGRVWTDHRLGHDLEIGGTWVHWSQPHTWAELSRYGITIDPSPKAETVYWLDQDDQVHVSEAAEFSASIGPAQAGVVHDSRDVFPRPDSPSANTRSVVFSDADNMTIRDRFDELAESLSPEEQGPWLASQAIWASHINGKLEDVALTAGLRWSAATGGGWQTLHEASSSYRVTGGMTSFIGNFERDLRAPVELNTRATRITSVGSDAVEVESAEGRIVEASAVIVTVPFAALDQIKFTPDLPADVQSLGSDALGNNGFKLWISVRGKVAPFSAYASAEHPIIMVKTEFIGEYESVLVGFGADHTQFDATSLDDARAMLARWRPDLEVTGVTTHDWMADEDSRTTWQLLRPGRLKHLTGAQATAGPIRFASSDNANLWPGFVDGAIERGLATAREIIQSRER
ncbi:flavin monoamine oxidase family protein [Gulosibacter molinativorax]|uniref:FAD-dependent oxidoreductase n=1 Tax=Gulosibacter molinativorax TaxID=256821 RepID=A0ABT7C6A5_9MICO|nr:NAD(P)/FAD-dependent oxidoreductase [Gulosibacter molinativorax]MDJ1370704.1 FAD-dependent oxidoreductase [Gulosibacter molinativorax]QUY63270.1 L-amino-acid oxidase [Gulosibacter molinativorax]